MQAPFHQCKYRSSVFANSASAAASAVMVTDKQAQNPPTSRVRNPDVEFVAAKPQPNEAAKDLNQHEEVGKEDQKLEDPKREAPKGVLLLEITSSAKKADKDI